jgi:hypothetical protein
MSDTIADRAVIQFELEQAVTALSHWKSQCHWDLAQAQAEIVMNCARRLHLIQQSESEKSRGLWAKIRSCAEL